jgi:hypothetical protein
VTYRRLELDERVCLVVSIGGASFAVGAKVSVMADGTLVADASDVALTRARSAEWSIAADSDVHRPRVRATDADFLAGLVDGHKSVSWVDNLGIGDAGIAVVPVRAIKALVANAINVLEEG